VSDTLTSDEALLHEKALRLEKIICDMGSILVAYSGGADSTCLLSVAADVLGSRCVAATNESVIYAPSDLQRARQMAVQLGVEHLTFTFDHLVREDFAANSPRRCYYCKRTLFEHLFEIARERDLQHVVDGSVVDDLGDYRPGMEACRELGVRSPLLEVGLTKAEVRQLARQRGLPTADLPSMACLASRVPYGRRITGETLHQIAEAEAFLLQLGLVQVRVRHHGEIARIEVAPEQLDVLTAEPVRTQVVNRLVALGFRYCTVDLLGYRSGSMNEVLTEEGVAGDQL
jgi:uncharacterized protein